MKITGKSKIFGIIGWPLSHSLSPVFHNAAFEYLGLECCYVPFPVEVGRLDVAIKAISALNIAGLNVTVPHKEGVIPYLSELSEEAIMVGAVNTIKVSGERLVGYNTDGRGFMDSLDEAGESVKGHSILVLGAGGAAKAVVFAVAGGGTREIFIANRTKGKAKALKEQVQKHFPQIKVEATGMEVEFLREVSSKVDMLINTTSLGLKNGDPSPMPRQLLHRDLFVCDLIYNPPETELIRYAKDLCRGHMNGLGMLLHQGTASFKLWTGVEPPVHIMRQALQDALQQRPSSGRM